jgi:hypothetical protein
MQVATNPFLRFYTFLAKMGLVMLDDPPKVVDLNGREWGEPVGGLALSIRELPRDDSRQVAGISVLLKNNSRDSTKLTIPPWIHFYEVAGLAPTPYGRQLAGMGGQAKTSEVTLPPDGANETELPIGRIYDMHAPGDYKIQVSCVLQGRHVLHSNEITVRV